MVEAINIDTSQENSGPSLEEEAAAQEAEAQKAQQADDGLPSDSGNEENSSDRPEWLPEKFQSAEDLAKAYSELEARMSKGDTGAKEEAQETAQEAVDNAGLDMSALQAEYNEQGTLTDQSYEALEKAGISRDIVDQYIAGQEAVANQMRDNVLSETGLDGDSYNQVIEWAADNLDDAQIDAYNKALETGDVNQMKLAVQGLKAQFDANSTLEPSRTLDGKRAAEGGVYNSVAELTKDMGDPRYSEDPAFRAKVEQKLARSNIL